MSDKTLKIVRDDKGRFVKGIPSPYIGVRGRFVNPLKGKKMPEEWRKKLMKPKSVTHPFSAEHIEKLRVSAKLRVGPLNGRWIDGNRARRSAKRRERLLVNGGSHTVGEWNTLKARYNWTCPCCKKSVPNIRLTKDHIISLVEGGSDNIENIQPLCGYCNVKKHTKSIRYA